MRDRGDGRRAAAPDSSPAETMTGQLDGLSPRLGGRGNLPRFRIRSVSGLPDIRAVRSGPLGHAPAPLFLRPGKRREGLADRFQDLLDELFEDRIVPWSLTDAQACARIMENKRRRGEPLDDHVPDAFLAAAVLTRGLAVLTRNTGVETVNPWVADPR